MVGDPFGLQGREPRDLDITIQLSKLVSAPPYVRVLEYWRGLYLAGSLLNDKL